MTVAASTSRADYFTNGATTEFAVPFYFLDESHVAVLKTTLASGLVDVLTLNSDYTVAGVGVGSGGTITTNTVYATGYKLTILRDVPYSQLTHYVPGDSFPASSHERALDLLTMQVQQLTEITTRALHLADNISGVTTQLPAIIPGAGLGWNADGLGIGNLLSPTTGTVEDARDMVLNLLADGYPDSGSKLVNHQAVYGERRSLFLRAQDMMCIFDFLTEEEIFDVRDGLMVYDLTAKIQEAIDTLTARSLTGVDVNYYCKALYFPAGRYGITDSLKTPGSSFGSNRIAFIGDGPLMSGIVQQDITKNVFEDVETVGTAGCMMVFDSIGILCTAGTDSQFTPRDTAGIMVKFGIGIRVTNCWITSHYNGIAIHPNVANRRIGSEDIYIWNNVVEFCQNCILIAGPMVQRTSTHRSRTSNVATLTTSVAHGLLPGQFVSVYGPDLPAAYRVARAEVLSTPSSTTFTYASVGADEGTTADTNGTLIYYLSTTSVVASRSRTSNVATITTTAPHGLIAGQHISISGVGGHGYNQSWVQVEAGEAAEGLGTAPTSDTFCYVSTGPNEGTTAEGADPGEVRWITGRSFVIADNEFASVTRSDGGTDVYVVNCQYADDIQVRNNKLAFAAARGFHFDHCKDVQLQGNMLAGTGKPGTSYGAAGRLNVLLNGCDTVHISHNEFANSVGEPNVELVGRNRHIAIKNNEFSQCVGSAAVLFSGTVKSDAVIQANTFKNLIYDGIKFSAASAGNVLIQGNHFSAYNTTSNLIYSTDTVPSSVVIEDNYPAEAVCVIQGGYRRTLHIDTDAAATTTIATVTMPNYGGFYVTLTGTALANGNGQKSSIARFTVTRATGACTPNADGAAVTWGASTKTFVWSIVDNGGAADIKLTTDNASGLNGDLDIDIRGTISGVTLGI